MLKYVGLFVFGAFVLVGAGCDEQSMTKAERLSYVKRVLADYESEDDSSRYADEIEKYRQELSKLETGK
ncbi:MAG: hypothetical protein JXR97_06840 [Planctomycetes bacterium]|nr:hypothetical protein [Planctomycetota bacterium]